MLIGHSMGTPVIRQYMFTYPTNVAAMVVVDGNLHMPNGGTPANLERLKGPDGPKNREAMIRTMFGKSATPEMQQHVVKMMLAPPESTATQAMTAMYEKLKWNDQWINVPAYGIFADHSTADDPAYYQEDFQGRDQHAGCGRGAHFVMMEKPAGIQYSAGGVLAEGEVLMMGRRVANLQPAAWLAVFHAGSSRAGAGASGAGQVSRLPSPI